jgi:hypothetical protein
MLNTESRLTAFLIWLAILALSLKFIWTLLALPPPADVLTGLAASPLADWLARNQIMVTGLVGFGGLALAHILNGWRDRAERRHVIERAEKRLAAVLAREASVLRAALDAAGYGLGQGRISPLQRTLVAEAVEPADRVLLSAPISDLAVLGPGAAAAVAALRQAARRISALASDRDEAAEQKLADAILEVARAARTAELVLATHCTKGPAAANRLRIVTSSNAAGTALAAPTPTRLLPAA